MSTKGIDVSRHQTIPDYAALKADGIDFVIVRAGYGGIVDSRFKEHITAAKKAGMRVGVYWFCYALDADGAVREADKCLGVIKGIGLGLPVFYDFEYDTERYANQHGTVYTPKLRTDIICAFCKRVQSAGYEVGVYTNPDYWNYRLVRGRLSGYRLWIASYVRRDCKGDFAVTKPEDIPAKFRDAYIWQFGHCNLGGQEIDVNYGYFPDDIGTIKVGDKYTLREGDVYSNGVRVPARLWGKVCTVSQVRNAEGRALLAEIKSWVRI